MALIDNILFYYKFDETSGTTAADADGGTYPGTLKTAASFNVDGKINYGLLSGSTLSSSVGGVDMGSNAGLDTSAFPVTISAWFKTSAAGAQSNGEMLIFSNQKTSSNFSRVTLGMVMGAVSGDRGKVQLTWRNSGGTTSQLTTTALYNDNTYHLVVATISAGGAMIIYIDGTSVASGVTASGTLFTGTKKQTIGTNWDVSISGVWIGMLDEIGYWNRELSGSEVTSLYNGGVGLQYPFSGGATVNSNFLRFM
jgi:hypothetical protein